MEHWCAVLTRHSDLAEPVDTTPPSVRDLPDMTAICCGDPGAQPDPDSSGRLQISCVAIPMSAIWPGSFHLGVAASQDHSQLYLDQLSACGDRFCSLLVSRLISASLLFRLCVPLFQFARSRFSYSRGC